MRRCYVHMNRLESRAGQHISDPCILWHRQLERVWRTGQTSHTLFQHGRTLKPVHQGDPSQGCKCMHMEIQCQWFQRAGAKERKSQCLEIFSLTRWRCSRIPCQTKWMCLTFLSVHIKIDEKYAIMCILVQFRKSMKVYVKIEKSSVFPQVLSLSA